MILGMDTGTVQSVDEEFDQIKARVRRGGQRCSVALLYESATDSEIQAYERAIAAGYMVAAAEHFRAKYPDTKIHQKAVRDHAGRRCGCFKS